MDPVFYHGTEIGRHRLDLLVEDEIVVELKAVRAFEDVHFAVVRSYLKAMGKKHGLLFNFSARPLGIRRVISP
jgi:GxxExxY protein